MNGCIGTGHLSWERGKLNSLISIYRLNIILINGCILRDRSFIMGKGDHKTGWG